jgi:hypothetical protein
MTIRALAHPHCRVTRYVPHYKTSPLFMQFLLIMHYITTYRLGTIAVERASEEELEDGVICGQFPKMEVYSEHILKIKEN